MLLFALFDRFFTCEKAHKDLLISSYVERVTGTVEVYKIHEILWNGCMKGSAKYLIQFDGVLVR